MATLTGNTIASTYTGLLSVSGAVGADTVEAVTDGAGTSTSLSLSQQRATITLGSGAADDFIVDGTTLVVEGDNNRVGIGTAAPECELHVYQSDGNITFSNADITIGTESLDKNIFAMASDGDDCEITFNHGTTSNDGRLEYASQVMSFWTGGTQRVTIDSAGDATFAGDIKMADGKGIDFSADASPAAGMTAEILDDYEEGTWTAVVTDGTRAMSMTGDEGYYTKIGNLVTVTGQFVTDSLDGGSGNATGNIYITGLPFTINAGAGAYSAACAGHAGGLDLAVAGQTVSYYGVVGNAYIGLLVWDDTAGVTAMQAPEWSDNGNMMVSFSYRVA
jgi:hypothetical protein